MRQLGEAIRKKTEIVQSDYNEKLAEVLTLEESPLTFSYE